MIETKGPLFHAIVFMRMFIFWNALAVLFTLFAFVQLNDPDPWVWFCIYMLNAFFLIGAAIQRITVKISFAMCIVCFAFACAHSPPTFEGFIGDMSLHPHIELAREAAGLFLVSLSQAGIAIYGAKKGPTS